MPRKILSDNYVLNVCPQYQPLGVPNALLPQVDNVPKLQGFKNIVPSRPTSISATISDLANNIYTPIPLNNQERAENLMRAQERVAEQQRLTIPTAPPLNLQMLAGEPPSFEEALRMGVPPPTFEEAIAMGIEEEDKTEKLRQAIRKSRMSLEKSLAEERVLGQRLEEVGQALKSLQKPVFEKNFQEMQERIKSSQERVRISLEDMPIRREIILPVSEEEEKVEVEVEAERPIEERVFIELQKRRKEAMKRIRQKPEEAEEMAGDRLAPLDIIKTKEIEVRPEVLREVERAEQIRQEFAEEPLKESRRPRRIGLRGSMAEQLR
jgi:hypothetical protein